MAQEVFELAVPVFKAIVVIGGANAAIRITVTKQLGACILASQ